MTTEILNENGILVFCHAYSIGIDQLFAIRESIKAQLADDPRFIFVCPLVTVHYLRPGYSTDSAMKSRTLSMDDLK